MSVYCGAVLVCLKSDAGYYLYDIFERMLGKLSKIDATASVTCGNFGVVLFEGSSHLAKSDISNILKSYEPTNCFKYENVTALSIDKSREELYTFHQTGFYGDAISSSSIIMDKSTDKLGMFKYHLQLMAVARGTTPYILNNISHSTLTTLRLTAGVDVFSLSSALLELLL